MDRNWINIAYIINFLYTSLRFLQPNKKTFTNGVIFSLLYIWITNFSIYITYFYFVKGFTNNVFLKASSPVLNFNYISKRPKPCANKRINFVNFTIKRHENLLHIY